MARTLVRRREVEERTGLGHSSIYREIKQERFPRPGPLGTSDGRGAPVAWLSDEIDLYVTIVVAARDGKLDELIAERRAERGTVEPWALNFAEALRRRIG